MNIPARLFAIPVVVETYAGQGAYGDAYAAPVTVLGHVTGGQRVQSASTGDEVVSSRRVLVPNPARLADGTGTVDAVALLAPESRITVQGVETTVSRVDTPTKPGSTVPVYVAVDLD